MILVCAFYAVTNFPVDIYYLLLNVNANVTHLEGGYYASVFTLFLYTCANPFIYAVKFDPVKRVLLGLNPCKKMTSVEPTASTSGVALRRVGTAADTDKERN